MVEIHWIAIALVAGFLAKTARLSTLVGYILVGLVLATLGMQAGDFIITVGDIGITLLLFTVGLHIRIKNILQPEVLGGGSIHLIISLLIFGSIVFFTGADLTTAIMLGVALGFSSTVLTAKTLESRDELDAYHGRVAIGVLILQDIVAIGLLAFTGTETPTIFAPLLFLLPLTRPVIYRVMDAIGQEELLLLFGLLLAFGFGELFGLVGISSKLGALVAGMLLVGHDVADSLYKKLWGIREVFLVGFFLQVGMVGVPTVTDVLVALGFLTLLAFKGLLFYALFVGFNLRARTAFMAGVSLTAYSEFALIVATAAVSGGILPTEWVTRLALLVAVSFALNALLSTFADNLWEIFGPDINRTERDVPHPEGADIRLGATNVIIVGMGRAGAAAYDYLKANNKRPLGIEADPAIMERHLHEGRRVVYGISQDPTLWDRLDYDKIESIILTLPDSSRKLQTIKQLRESGYTGQISALTRDEDTRKLLEDTEVVVVPLPIAQAGYELARASMGEPTVELAPSA